MAIIFNDETGEAYLTGDEKIICQMAGIDAAELVNRRAGLFPDTMGAPDPEVIAKLGYSEEEYYLKISGMQEHAAENWAICEGVLIKTYHKGQALSKREATRAAEEAETEERRRRNAAIAAKNREAFYNNR